MPAEPTPTRRAAPAAGWTWPKTPIARVVDGDTVDAVVTRDIGFNGSVTFPVRLRLNRINAPSVHSARGRRARDRVEQLVADVVTDLTTLKPYKYGGPDDATGEWMAEVTLPDGSNLSDLLVTEDLATYWTGQGPRPDDGDAPVSTRPQRSLPTAPRAAGTEA